MGDDSWIQLWRSQASLPCRWKTSRRANRWSRVLQIFSNTSKLRLISSGVSTIRLQMPWSPRVWLDSEIMWSLWFTAYHEIPQYELNFKGVGLLLGPIIGTGMGTGFKHRDPQVGRIPNGTHFEGIWLPHRWSQTQNVSCCKPLRDLQGNITGYRMISMDIS